MADPIYEASPNPIDMGIGAEHESGTTGLLLHVFPGFGLGNRRIHVLVRGAGHLIPNSTEISLWTGHCTELVQRLV